MVVTGPVIEVVKGGLIVDIGLRGFLPASLVELRRVRELQPYVGRVIEAKIIELDRNRNNVVLSRRAWLEETQKEQRGDFLQQPQAGRAPQGRRLLGGQLRCLRRPRRHGRPRPRVRAQLEARRPPVVGGLGRRRDRGRGARRRSGQGAHQPVAQGHPVRPLAGVRRLATRWASWSTAASPSWCPSAPSSRWATASRAWSTSRRWPSTTSTCPSRWSRPGEELWVKIIDIDLQRRRISLSIKQAAEGGEVSEEYREAFGEHAYDAEGNYIGFDYAEGEFTPETEAQAAWADFAEETGTHVVPLKDAEGNDIPPAEGEAPVEGQAPAPVEIEGEVPAAPAEAAAAPAPAPESAPAAEPPA